MDQNNEKKMTNYDRKVLAKEAAQKRAKTKSILTTIGGVVITLGLIALIVSSTIMKNKKPTEEFFQVNGQSVSNLEFTFHKTNMINQNATMLQYMGITSGDQLAYAVYDEATGATWDDFFTERTAASIKENKALIADAKKNNFTCDLEKEYASYMEQIKAQADSSGMSVETFLLSMYGGDEKKLKKFIEDNLTALLYTEHLATLNAATEEEAQAKYDENKDDYDSVDYRVLEFATGMTDESTEEEIETAMADAKKKAQEMLDKVKAGEDFETLCATYAPEDKRTEYADSETDLSLVTDATSYYIYEPYGDWLFEAERKAGDSTLYTDEDNYSHYVVLFEKRYMGEDVIGTIQQSLTYTAVAEYIASISESYVISDPKGNIPVLN